MKASNDNQGARFNNSVWDFLAEYPLNELLVDMDLRDKPEAGLLFQTVRRLGIRQELLDVIERKLIQFASEAPALLNQRRFDAPTSVRLFYQSRTIEEVFSTNTSSQRRQQQSINSSKLIHHSDPETKGGWGYFLVERGGDSPPGESQRTINLVDLYLYKEGE